MFRSISIIDRFLDFFTLPQYYLKIRKLKECKKSGFSIAFDLIKLFYSYKTFPDHYGPCRLWEVNKSDWKYYYGSNYRSHQRARLQRQVQPREYQVLFNNKAVCERLCRETGVSMPCTLGIISQDHNYREKIILWLRNSVEDTLVIKPLCGGAGYGIVLAKKINNNILIQSKTELIQLIDFNLSEDAIVQEALKQDHRMSAFSLSSVNTIRVVTMFTKDDSIIVLGATMRCGVGKSYVDNWSAGGVAVGVNLETGRLKKYAYDKGGTKYIAHPTSKVVFEDFIIPEWQNIIDTAVKIQGVFPWYRILGMDIALRENGRPVLIEVNDSTDLLFQEQTSGPLLKRESVLRAFGQYDLFINSHQRKLYASLANQLNNGP